MPFDSKYAQSFNRTFSGTCPVAAQSLYGEFQYLESALPQGGVYIEIL